MKRSIKILWRLFAAGILFVVILLLCANFGVFGKMPSVEELENPEADLASEIYSSDGVLMGKYYAENRSEVKYSEISQNVIHALIATEDERFYDHSGIDAQALARVIFTLGTQGGGSTITQQVAKMMLGQGKGNVLRRGIDKMKEWIVAVKLERNFTKEEIITLYLNRAPWGNVYGIRNASRTYFQKEPKDLTIEEAAVLIGMLKGFVYNPIGHPKAALDRRNTVIGQMVVCKEHYLTEDEAAKLKAKPLITNYKKIDEVIGIAPYFRDVLKVKMKEICKTLKNPKTGEPYDLFRDGLKIYTTIDSRMQQYAEEAVAKHMPVIQKKLDYNLKILGNRMWKDHEKTIFDAMKYTERWKNMKEEDIGEDEIKKSFYVPVKMKVFAWNDKREKDTIMTPYDSIKYHKQLMQTSFAALDPHSGEVKCWVGGIDYKWFKFDHITTARQVGSTFKPFVYSLGIMEAGYTPETVIPGGGLVLGGKMVSSSGGTVANCLAFSKNIAPWRMIGQIGVKRVIEFAQAAGVTTKLPPYYSIALGAAEIPMLEMLHGYTMFPNGGLSTEPIMINRIEDKNGNVIKDFQATTNQVMADADAYTMVFLMQGVIKFGTARSLGAYKIPVEKAGKTGTTTGNTDGWFIGYTPELLAGTWVGCEDPFIRIYAGTAGGSEMAAPSWGMFMEKSYADKKLGLGKVTEFPKPANAKTGPTSADALTDLFSTGGDSTIDDQGNGGADDFISMPNSGEPAESDIPKKDTSKKREEKKPVTPAPAAAGNKPADDKKPKPKPSSNEY